MPDLTVLMNQLETLPLNQFTKANYHFLGWSKTSDGAVEYSDGAEYKMTAGRDVTLYAIWEADLRTLKFDSNGGSGTMTPLDVPIDSIITLPVNQFVKYEYHFVGWSSTPNGSIEYLDQASYRMTPTSAAILYAVWEADPVTIYGLPSDQINVGTSFTLYPSIDDQSGGSGWSYDPSFFTASFNSPATFTPLKSGTTVIRFTALNGQSASVTVVIDDNKLPDTGIYSIHILWSYLLVLLGSMSIFINKKKERKDI